MPRGGKGYFEYTDQVSGTIVQLPTLTCAHCNRVVILHPQRQRERHWCFKCDAYVCDLRVCMTECNPFMQSVDLALELNGSQAFLPRGYEGEILFDPKLRDERKPY